MTRRVVFAILLMLAVVLYDTSARADCTLTQNGQTRPAGTIVLETVNNIALYCNGTVWIPLGNVAPDCTDDLAETCVLHATRDSNDPEFTAANIASGMNILGVTGTYTGTGGNEAFLAFTDLSGQSTSTLVTSNILQVSLSGTTSISISGSGSPQYRICADSTCTAEVQTWGSAPGTINDGQFLQLRLTSSASFITAVAATMTVGLGSDQWNVTTAPQDTAPNAFTFTDQLLSPTSTLISSNILQINGITGDVSLSISGDGSPEFRTCSDATCTAVVVNWTSAPATIQNGQRLQLRLTSSASYLTMHSATVTVGTASDQWDVRTVVGCEGSPSPGDVCNDLSVYAGLSPDGNVPMYTTPADAPALQSWNDGSVPAVNTSMVNCITSPPGSETSCQTGEANTALLVGLSDADSPYDAAVYCDGLSAHGYNDWYLPAQDELNVLRTNRVAIGGFNTGGTYPNGYYWSSSEGSTSPVISGRMIVFSSGADLLP